MKLVSGVRSFFNGQTQEAFGLGQRTALTSSLRKDIRRHIANLSGADLTGYTYERRRSDYPQAKSDLVIYDPTGKPVLDGRELSGGVSFWPK